jgi:GntR family transcriptional regulator
MLMRLDHHSGEPIYQQIVEAIKYKVAAGELSDGTQLPSIRSLAEQLGINPRTVVKAYEELDHSGVVVMRHGQGVFVSARGEVAPSRIRREAIAGLARRLLAEAARLGADPDEVLKIMRAEAELVAPRKKETT